ncbi:MAG: sodium:solute symporter family protein [Limisphaerales bacterium]|jgi:SSS family solute:Na+ symporter
MHLTTLDWTVIVGYFLINIGIGLYYRRRAGSSTEEFFVSGRQVSWWLAGTSMVATTFAADTPLAVTGLVATNGIAGNWVWWNMLLSGMLTVFFFARLWRRAGVVTDVEFVEMRYSGGAAAFLRGFRAIYLGLPVNCIVLGWVNLAMVKILTVMWPDLAIPALGVEDPKIAALVIVVGLMLLTAGISTLSGLWGVLVTDMFQFVLMMTMMIALAYYAVDAVGGLGSMVDKLAAVDAARGGEGSVMDFMPVIGSAWMPAVAFCVFLGVTWWATWYPGAEPGGGGYVAQRIFSAKDEKHSFFATLWFTVAHYAIRPWPWILVALASLILYPDLTDREAGFVQAVIDPNVFPRSMAGLMLAAFFAAYMSTVATQLNWGASYLVNDAYRRFMVSGRSDAHYVAASRVATVILMLASAVVTYFQESIAGAWQFLMAIGAGTGSVLILRWFWWRINAWSEVSAMVASFAISMILQFGLGWKASDPREFAWTVLVTVAGSTVIWLLVTFLTQPENNEQLVRFYRKVRPSTTALWGPIAAQAPDVHPAKDGPANLLHWVLGVTTVYCVLFAVGKLLLGSWTTALILGVIAVFSTALLARGITRQSLQ